MQRLPIREISKFCEHLQSSQCNDMKLQHTISDGIRTRVVNSDTLPLLLQRLTLSGNWQLAVRLIQSEHLDKRHIRRDQNAWPIIERAAPCEASREAIRQAMQKLYEKKFISRVR